ncbi:MAG: hypothetical protein ACPGVU_05245 [Limisphaerales bacterium]
MAFVKRNIFWIIGGLLSVGMIAAALMFTSGAKAKAEEKITELAGYTNTVNRLKDATPYPSPEAIAQIKDDTEKVKGFSKEAEAMFTYDKPPEIPPRRFKVHLINTLVSLQGEATNYNVRLPPNFNFTFSHLLPMPNLLPYSVAPLGERLQDIQYITQILFESRVHSIDSFLRVPAYGREPGGRVLMYDVGIRTNLSTAEADFTSTPYRFSFRGFTTELTEVLNRFASSDRFYVVRQIEVQGTQSAEPGMVASRSSFSGMGSMDAEEDSGGGGGTLRTAQASLLAQARAQQMMRNAGRTVQQSPLRTIVDERPLLISMMIDVVKLVPKPTAPARQGGPPGGPPGR